MRFLIVGQSLLPNPTRNSLMCGFRPDVPRRWPVWWKLNYAIRAAPTGFT